MKFVFQPLIDLTKWSLLGFEALARFEDSASPAEHFDAARGEGRLTDLELQAIEGIIAATSSLPDGTLVTLNASGPTIEAFSNSPLALDPRLKWGLELNEQSEPCVCDGARRLATSLDCLLLIDDAGVAHATRERILRLCPDIVKLDRTMISEYGESEQVRLMVDSLLEAATSIGAKTLAEGVESPQQLELVRTLGFDYAQGYYFSPGQQVNQLRSTLSALHRRIGIDIPSF
ncbi:EAL domain-containing protein [Glutamicibacter arilaitensis]|uniref:EAL domain-containing protein n=1 Tax=Glutamicibacter arilaitensis TaxID=256701 RepID=UPI00384B4D32